MKYMLFPCSVSKKQIVSRTHPSLTANSQRPKANFMQSYKIVNKKLPHTYMQGSFYIFLTNITSRKNLSHYRWEPFLRETNMLRL